MAAEPALAVITHDDARDRYEIVVDGRRIGHLDYVRRGDVLDLHHTEIDPSHEGRGFGARLVGEVLADIRRRGLRIAPTCSFVAAYVRRHPAEADLAGQPST